MISDRRSDTQDPWRWVVFTDTFLSGWGLAKGGRSLYAIAVKNQTEADTVLAHGKGRTDMKRGRLQKRLPRLRPHDHLAIVDRTTANSWFA